MRITAIHERSVSIGSAIRNAYIDFSRMSVNIVALVTDAVRDGHPVIAFGFNSNSRYAPSCLLCEPFIPRLLDAASEDLLDETVSNFDPAKIWACAPTRRPIQRFGRIRSVPILRGLHNQH